MSPDLKLLIGGDGIQVEIMVFHQVMIKASPVFAAMLKPDQFREGARLTQDKQLELPLPDDNVEAMTALCNILTLQPWKVPTRTVTPDLLENIATIVDKYDFTRAIQPWPEIWFQQEHIQTELNRVEGLPMDILPRWIHICYHLGYSRHFKILTSALTTGLGIDNFNQSSVADNFAMLPQVIEEEIHTIQQRCADRFRRLSLDLIDRLEQGQSCKAMESSNYNEREAFDCSSVLLGNAILALRETFGPGWRLEEAWTGSLTELYQQMEKIARKLTGPSRICDFSGYGRTQDHCSCIKTTDLLSPMKPIYERAATGLRLEELGKAFYREIVEVNS